MKIKQEAYYECDDDDYKVKSNKELEFTKSFKGCFATWSVS